MFNQRKFKSSNFRLYWRLPLGLAATSMFDSTDVLQHRCETWEILAGRNCAKCCVFFHSFVASRAPKVKTEVAKDRLPKMSKKIAPQNRWNIVGSEHFWKLSFAKFAPRCGARAVWKSKSLKTDGLGAFLRFKMLLAWQVSTRCKIRGRRRTSWGVQKTYQLLHGATAANTKPPYSSNNGSIRWYRRNRRWHSVWQQQRLRSCVFAVCGLQNQMTTKIIWQPNWPPKSIESHISWQPKSFEPQIIWQPNHFKLKSIDNQIIGISNRLTTTSFESQSIWQPNHLNPTSFHIWTAWISNQLTTKIIWISNHLTTKSVQSQIIRHPNHLNPKALDNQIIFNW